MLDCNVILNGYHGAIEITKQENQRLDKCSWTIMVPQSNRVNITFTSVQISHSPIQHLFTGRPLPAIFKNQRNTSQLAVSKIN